MTLDISWSYLCVCLTGSQFWRSSRKILVAKTSETANLRKGKGKKRKLQKQEISWNGCEESCLMIQKMRMTLWIPALFHPLSDLSRQVSAAILWKKNLPKY